MTMEFLWFVLGIPLYLVLGAVNFGLNARVWDFAPDDDFALFFFGVLWPVGVVISLFAGFVLLLGWIATKCSGGWR